MAYTLNGSSQYFSGSPSPVTALPVTMVAWFKSNSVTADQFLVAINDAAGANNYFGMRAAGAQTGDPILASQYAGIQGAASTSGYSTGSFFHAAGVLTSTSSKAAFINGGSKGTNANAEGVSSITTTRLSIGAVARNTGPTVALYLNGDIAEAAIWSATLDDSEIAALGKGFKPTRIRPQSLMFYAPLIRSVQDVRAGLALTNNNSATVADHPRVY